MSVALTRRGFAGLGVGSALAITTGKAAAQTQSVAGDTLAKVRAAGKVLVGIRNDFPPVGSIDVAGKPVGFGPDLGEVLAKKLDVKTEFVPVTSRTRIPLLQNGSIDLEIGITTPTVEREKTVDFSIPYVWDAGALLIRQGSSKRVKDYGPPKKVACTQGSYNIQLVKEQVPDAVIEIFQEYPDAVLALKNNKVDAVGINKASAVAFTKPGSGLEMSEEYVKDPWSIMVRQNDSNWRTWINHTLQEVWKEGTYKTLFEKHFGEPPQFYMYSPYMLQPGVK